jgi:hypothetical protein
MSERPDVVADVSKREPARLRAGVRGQPRLARLRAGGGAALFQRVFVLGLAAVFLTNALVAVVDPAAFTELVAESPVGWIVGSAIDRWVAPAIALNDLGLGVALLAVHRRPWLQPPLLAWAGLWLMIVTLVKLTTLG